MRTPAVLGLLALLLAALVALANGAGAERAANASQRVFLPGSLKNVPMNVARPTPAQSSTPTPTLAPISTLLPANPSGTTQLQSANGALKLSLPPGVAQVGGQNVAVNVGVQQASPPSSNFGVVGLKAVDITMQTQDGQSISQLAQPMTIEFDYTDDELDAGGVAAADLMIAYSSDGGQTWTPLDTTLDPYNRRVYAQVSHLTRFTMGGPPPGATSTSTRTSTATFTATPTNTPTNSPTVTRTPTITPTRTNSPTNTPSPTNTNSPTITPTNTRTNTPTVTPTFTSSPTFTNTPVGTNTPTPTSTSTGVPLISSWRVNPAATSVALTGVAYDVQSVAVATVGHGTPIVKIVANDVPSYSRTMNATVIATLTARPAYATNFPSGIQVTAGTPVSWGQSIGYSSSTCFTPTPGAGYWPPGPVCPSTQSSSTITFPLTPAPASTHTTTTGRIGYWVNGVPIYNWGDAQVMDGVWYRNAGDFEKYDMDIDNGHSSNNGMYHHHFYPSGLAAQLGDTGTGHSPIYGFAADGYPIYGPWYASGVLAQSGWQKRVYSASSLTGCGADNVRSCLFSDQAHPTATVATTPGPNTTDTYTTSNHSQTLTLASGVFAQDYYYDSSQCTNSVACLDQYNGHNHDGLGYHYHVTVTDSTTYTPAFPYVVGFQYYGQLPQGSFGILGDERPGSWVVRQRIASPTP